MTCVTSCLFLLWVLLHIEFKNIDSKFTNNFLGLSPIDFTLSPEFIQFLSSFISISITLYLYKKIEKHSIYLSKKLRINTIRSNSSIQKEEVDASDAYVLELEKSFKKESLKGVDKFLMFFSGLIALFLRYPYHKFSDQAAIIEHGCINLIVEEFGEAVIGFNNSSSDADPADISIENKTDTDIISQISRHFIKKFGYTKTRDLIFSYNKRPRIEGESKSENVYSQRSVRRIKLHNDIEIGICKHKWWMNSSKRNEKSNKGNVHDYCADGSAFSMNIDANNLSRYKLHKKIFIQISETKHITGRILNLRRKK